MNALVKVLYCSSGNTQGTEITGPSTRDVEDFTEKGTRKLDMKDRKFSPTGGDLKMEF